MHTSRITNASLFVTVLSACLGLVATGVPTVRAQAQPGMAAAVNMSRALIAGASAAAQLTTQRAGKLAAASNSFFRIDICQAQSGAEENLYQNSRALTNRNHLLVVTRLPRAALSHGPAEHSQPESPSSHRS